MQIELILNTSEDQGVHIVWTIPAQTLRVGHFFNIVDAALRTTSTEELSYEQPDDEFLDRTCPVCDRTFASPGNLKQHQTVAGHHDKQ